MDGSESWTSTHTSVLVCLILIRTVAIVTAGLFSFFKDSFWDSGAAASGSINV